MIVRELITRLGLDADTKVVDQWDRRIAGLAYGLGLVSVAAAAVGGALVKMASSAADEAESILKLQKATLATASDIQALRYAAQQAETPVEAIGNALVFMRKTTGKTGLSDFLEEIDRINALPENKIVEEMMKVFGRGGKDLLPLLATGTDGIRELIAEFRSLGIEMSDDQIAAADQYGDSVSRLQRIVKGLSIQIGADFIPVLQRLVDSLFEWYMANREVIRARIDGVIKASIAVLRPLGQILGLILTVLGKITDALVKGLAPALEVAFYTIGLVGATLFIAKLGALGAALTTVWGILRAVNILTAVWAATTVKLAAAWAFLTAPLTIIVAIAAAVGLLIQDIRTWQRGGESLIGSLIGSWGAFLDKIDAVVAHFRQRMQDLRDDVAYVVASWREAWTSLVEFLTGLWDGFLDGLFGRIEAMLNLLRAGAQLFGFGDPQQAALSMSMPGSGRTTNISQRNRVDVRVPAGSNREQADFITTAINDALGLSLSSIAESYPELESGG